MGACLVAVGGPVAVALGVTPIDGMSCPVAVALGLTLVAGVSRPGAVAPSVEEVGVFGVRLARMASASLPRAAGSLNSAFRASDSGVGVGVARVVAGNTDGWGVRSPDDDDWSGVATGGVGMDEVSTPTTGVDDTGSDGGSGVGCRVVAFL